LTLFALLVILLQTDAIGVEYRAKYIATAIFILLGAGSTVIALMTQKFYYMKVEKSVLDKT